MFFYTVYIYNISIYKYIYINIYIGLDIYIYISNNFYRLLIKLRVVKWVSKMHNQVLITFPSRLFSFSIAEKCLLANKLPSLVPAGSLVTVPDFSIPRNEPDAAFC